MTGGQDDFAGYDEVRTSAAVEVRSPGGLLVVAGRDALSFLQGVLTNDVAALAPGQACYAAHLTAQGRMVSDMHVLRRDLDVHLAVEPAVAAALASRFDQSIFTEAVTIDDRSASVTSIAVHGPAAPEAVAAAAGGPVDAVCAALLRDGHVTLDAEAGELVAFGWEWLGVRGARVMGHPADVGALRERLAAAGLPELGSAALEARRIEAGTPVFGVDMTTDTIPLEAGIESRAISMTKGCYVGQEIVVRILHRAHGRVARRLVGLAAAEPIARGSSVCADGREVGTVTSAAWSPALGSTIALAMVHRDQSEPGTLVAVGGPAGPSATVRELPLLRG